MQASSRKIVVCAGARTPVGHIARSLAAFEPQDLMKMAVEAAVERARLPKDAVDGLIVGWVGQAFNAPNIARVVLLNAGLPPGSQAVTVQNNCISSIEATASAARFILMGEGETYLAGGTECMSRLPYTIAGSRADKELRSMETLKAGWGSLLQSKAVSVVDSMEQGLTDPVKGINMAGTAEVCAQMFGISRQAQDAYALESFHRALEGWKSGFYASHVFSVKTADGKTMERDEYPFLREDLASNPAKFAKAPLLFDNSSYGMKDFYRDFGKYIEGRSYAEGSARGTVTLFNSCGRSDGAAAAVVTTEGRAKVLGLEVLAEIKGWGFYGNNPAHMGISPALAAPVALKRAGVSFKDLDRIELHEPFAATVLSIFKVGKEKFGHDWEAKHKEGALNPHGGSIAIGHPLGMTGTRLLLNLIYELKSSGKRLGMIAACAGGGMGGAMVLERS